MGVGTHLADISNPSKSWNLALKWTELLFEEFFKQGDKERELGIGVSDLMDRSTTNIAKAQLGFIDIIVEPAFETFSKF
jgi:cAMP-specific phosphodiesterase 4